MAVITTRDIASAAGVSEVTVFRHVGDKASLAREAVRRFHPAAVLDAYDPAIDASTPLSCFSPARRSRPRRGTARRSQGDPGRGGGLIRCRRYQLACGTPAAAQ